ncbi:MAG: DUF4347 domain-containing protein [Symploca sp. SIO2B6]|nr:DUF4347 domain-containing protein [Symploca sp. SIO2B6]
MSHPSFSSATLLTELRSAQHLIPGNLPQHGYFLNSAPCGTGKIGDRSTPIPRHQVVIIDATVDDYQHLVNGAIEGTDVFVLDAQHDGIRQITQILQQLKFRIPNPDLHIIAHGTPGTLYLGNSELNRQTLSYYVTDLHTWFAPSLLLSPTLNLYACNVAAGDTGAEFLEALSALTGATLAASNRLIGDGHWQLDVQQPCNRLHSYPCPNLPSPLPMPSHPHSLSNLPIHPSALLSYPHTLAPGDRDTNFGNNGIVTTDIGFNSDDGGWSITTDDNGNILVGGYTEAYGSNDFALIRYTATGELDTSFGQGGIAIADIGTNSDDLMFSITIDINGNILVSGASNANGSNDFTLARYTADGFLDTNFGTGGIVSTDIGFGSSDYSYSITTDGNGNIVVAGTSDASGSSDFTLVRYTADGSLDLNFGTDGIVTTDIGGFGSSDSGYGLVTDSSGNILVSGSSDASGSSDFTVVRYTTTGELDHTFGTGGIVTTDIGVTSNDSANGITIDSNGNILVSGYSNANGSNDFAVVRYTPDGTVDTTFGTAGIVITDINAGSEDAGWSVATDSQGNVLVGGDTYNNDATSDDFALVRYTTAGILDTTFGLGGIVTTSISAGSEDAGLSIAIDSNDNILAVGSTVVNGISDVAVVRYVGGAPPFFISGVPEEDSTLTADISNLFDGNSSPDSSTYYYSWEQSKDGGESWEHISGGDAEHNTFTPGDEQAGADVRVTLSYANLPLPLGTFHFYHRI